MDGKRDVYLGGKGALFSKVWCDDAAYYDTMFLIGGQQFKTHNRNKRSGTISCYCLQNFIQHLVNYKH